MQKCIRYYKRHEDKFADLSSYLVVGSSFDGCSLATITPLNWDKGGLAPGVISDRYVTKGENVQSAVDKAIAALDEHYLTNGYQKSDQPMTA